MALARGIYLFTYSLHMVLADSVWPLRPRYLVVVSALGAHHGSCSRQDHHTLATWYCCCNAVLFSQLFFGIAPTLGCGAHSVLRPPLVVAFPLFCLVLIPPTSPSRSSPPYSPPLEMHSASPLTLIFVVAFE